MNHHRALSGVGLPLKKIKALSSQTRIFVVCNFLVCGKTLGNVVMNQTHTAESNLFMT